ncbi:MAG: glycosyltransferase, partial [Bacteroidales bacterium]|nr:glycosyltransferase [Bacteroidales bacterium]
AGADRHIIVDDASDNFNPADYESSYVIDTKVYRNEKNLGCFKTINEGVAQIKTDDWISAQADDDTWHAVNFPKLVKQLRKSKADIVHFPCIYYGKMSGFFGVSKNESFDDLKKDNNIYGASFFKKHVWDALGGFKLDVAGDWDFWLRAMKSGFTFEYFPLVCAWFRVSDRSMFERSLKKIGRCKINKSVKRSVDNWEGVTNEV